MIKSQIMKKRRSEKSQNQLKLMMNSKSLIRSLIRNSIMNIKKYKVELLLILKLSKIIPPKR